MQRPASHLASPWAQQRLRTWIEERPPLKHGPVGMGRGGQGSDVVPVFRAPRASPYSVPVNRVRVGPSSAPVAHKAARPGLLGHGPSGAHMYSAPVRKGGEGGVQRPMPKTEVRKAAQPPRVASAGRPHRRARGSSTSTERTATARSATAERSGARTSAPATAAPPKCRWRC
jgi:hypothetical protein